MTALVHFLVGVVIFVLLNVVGFGIWMLTIEVAERRANNRRAAQSNPYLSRRSER